jgi:predicted DsbA family dithiol-disulfide isomerase
LGDDGPVLIEVWSDVICPWCYVGAARFERVLAAFEHRADVVVRYRSFELDPSVPPGQITSVVDMLQAKYGGSREQVLAMEEQMAGLAAAEGLGYTAERPTGNSLDAHRILHLAADRGQGDVVRAALWSAHFGSASSVFDHASLTELAVGAGLDAGEVAGVLGSDQYLDAVRADEARAAELGISGVPFFVFGDTSAGSAIGLSGAQPEESFASALARGYAESAEARSA